MPALWADEGEGSLTAPDPIVAAVRADLLRRSAAGIAKYGTTLARTDFPLREWLRMAYEEALDHALYLKRAMVEMDAGETPPPPPTPAPTPRGSIPSPAEIEAGKTPRGAWTRAQLAEWGVPWPPPGGWKRRLEDAWRAAHPQFEGMASAPPTDAPVIDTTRTDLPWD